MLERDGCVYKVILWLIFELVVKLPGKNPGLQQRRLLHPDSFTTSLLSSPSVAPATPSTSSTRLLSLRCPQSPGGVTCSEPASGSRALPDSCSRRCSSLRACAASYILCSARSRSPLCKPLCRVCTVERRALRFEVVAARRARACSGTSRCDVSRV